MTATPHVYLSDEETQYARLIAPSRLAALEATGLLNGAASDVLDRIARLVTRLVGVPVSLVSLVDDARQHFPGMVGLDGEAGDVRGTPLSHSYCQYVVKRDQPYIVNNAAADELASRNKAHTELGIAAYAGVPLRTAEGVTLGALCAINVVPEQWTAEQLETMTELAAIAMSEIELRSTARALLLSNRRLAEQLIRDSVTGLLNRAGFSVRAEQELSQAKQAKQSAVVCALNLNGFHAVNHAHGYECGDSALVEVAALLEGTFRPVDIVARLGADQFVALIVDAAESDIPFITARLAAAFDVHNASPHRLYALDARVGFAVWSPAAPVSIKTLLQRAESSMRDTTRSEATL